MEIRRGKVGRRVNDRGRCNLRFAIKTSASTLQQKGDTACDEEEHRVGRDVKHDPVPGVERPARSASGRRASRAAGPGRLIDSSPDRSMLARIAERKELLSLGYSSTYVAVEGMPTSFALA